MEAQEYEKLVKALRCCSKDKCGQCEYEWNQNREFCMNSMCADAAAAIEALREDRDEWIDRCYHSDEKVAELSEKVAELQAEVDELKDELYKKILRQVDDGKFEALEPHWVSVGERLPEPNKLNKRGFCETYLVRYQWCGDSFAVARWNGRYWILWEHSQVIKNVTHWMPIEPPQEVQDADK